MKKLFRTEYIMMIILLLLISVYGYFSEKDVNSILMVIITTGFTSKAAADFGKNKGEKNVKNT